MLTPYVASKLRQLQKGSRGEEVRLLHALLNQWLGPPEDQLPKEGVGALDFGPRTEAKVKTFQKKYKIDAGKPHFPDGIVGPHTWAALHHFTSVEANLYFWTLPTLTLPSLPSFLPKCLTLPSTPSLGLDLSPLVTPVTRPSGQLQIQAGGSGSLPLFHSAAEDPPKPGLYYQAQVSWLLLGDPEIDAQQQLQVGVVGTKDMLHNGNWSLGVFGTWQSPTVKPLKRDELTLNAQFQETLYKNLDKRGGSSVTQANLSLNWALISKGGRPVLQASGQFGPYVEIDSPSDTNSRVVVSAGLSAFLGLTFSAYTLPPRSQ